MKKEKVEVLSTLENSKKAKIKSKGAKALFISSIVMGSIALVIFVFGLIMAIVFKGILEDDSLVALLFIALFAFPILVGAISELFAIIGLVNASILFSKEKNAKSITMFVITLLELSFLPLVILTLFVF